MRLPHHIGLASVFALCTACSKNLPAPTTNPAPHLSALPENHQHTPPLPDCHSIDFIYSLDDVFHKKGIDARNLTIETCKPNNTASVSGSGISLTNQDETFELSYQQYPVVCPQDGPVWRTIVGIMRTPKL